MSKEIISRSRPTIGVLYVESPSTKDYSELCAEKIRSITKNGISPQTFFIKYSVFTIKDQHKNLPILALEKIYGPTCKALASYYLSQVDGLLLLGDKYDVDPSLYGEKKHEKTNINPDPRRSLLVREIIRQARDLSITPGLAICGSMQQFTVVEKGSLIQHVPDVTDKKINHLQREKKHEVVHPIDVPAKPGSLYSSLVKPKGHKGLVTIGVNSIHHQAANAKTLPKTLELVATAPDGTVEALEHRFAPWILTQYHPEFSKRLDSQGKRSLDNKDYYRNHNDGKDYDNKHNLLPPDEDYNASEQLLRSLIDQSFTRCKMKQVVQELNGKEKLGNVPPVKWKSSL